MIKLRLGKKNRKFSVDVAFFSFLWLPSLQEPLGGTTAEPVKARSGSLRSALADHPLAPFLCKP
jgi:hypothetical protein